MTDAPTLDAYGVRTEPATVRLQRLLPGPIERVWAYLTESDLRRQWLAAGPMELTPGGAVELTWRNGELSPGEGRPESMPAEHSMTSRMILAEPPRVLAFTWNSGEVRFDLEPQGDQVLLTVTHQRLPDHGAMLSVSAGWHAHLDVLADKLAGRTPGAFWSKWTRLREEYAERLAE